MILNKKGRQKIKNDIIYICIVILIFIIKTFPRKFSLMLATRIGDAGFFIAREERLQALSNLEYVFQKTIAEKERLNIAKKVFQNVMKNLVDAVLMEKLLRNEPEKHVEITGLEYVENAKSESRGVVFLTAHTGCFEMLSPRLSQLGFKALVTGAHIYDDRLNKLIFKHRNIFNVNYIERENVTREVIKGLRNGVSFGSLCDLDTRGESRFVDFFGKPAKTVSGPFKLGIKFKAPIIPIFTVRRADGTQLIKIFPEIKVEGNTEDEKIINAMKAYNTILENIILEDPTQWIWMHNRWKTEER